MSQGPTQYFTGGIIASAASTGTHVDFGTKAFSKVFVKLPTMSTGAACTLYGSVDSTNFYPVLERVNTAPVQWQTMVVATSTSGAFVELGQLPFRFVKFAASATVTDGSGNFIFACQD